MDMSSFGGFGSYIAPAMSMIGAMTSKAGYSGAADAARVAGERKAALDQFQAEQLRVNAGQQIAAAQRTAQDVNLTTELIASHAKAVAAASGAGATDPTVVRLIAFQAGQGAYKANMALYNGEEAARGMRMQGAAYDYQAELDRAAGEDKAKAYDTAGDSSLFSAGSSLFAKYGVSGSATKGGDGLRTPVSMGQTDAYAVGGFGT